MKFIFAFLALITIIPTTQMKCIYKNGMRVEWKFTKEGQLQLKVFAPTKGWLAIGFNEQEKLIGSNLIMAAIKDKQNIISDRYILGLGKHKPVHELGAISQVKWVSGEENARGTTIEFILNAKSIDAYHFNLLKGSQLHLMLAYSQEDDFQHHSTMRTSTKIIL